MLGCVAGLIQPDVSKERSAFICMGMWNYTLEDECIAFRRNVGVF
jgi:hypothetical protein